MNYDNSVQLYSNQNPWTKWATAYKAQGVGAEYGKAEKQPGVDADNKNQAYVYKPGEGIEQIYTPATQGVGSIETPWGAGYVSTGFNPFNPGVDTNGELRSNYGPEGTATAFAHNPELRNGVSGRLADMIA